MAFSTRQAKRKRICPAASTLTWILVAESTPTTPQGLLGLTTVFFDAPAAHG